MNSEKNSTPQTQEALQDNGKASRSVPRALAVIIILGFILAAALLPGYLSEDNELPGVALESGEETPVSLSVAPEPTQDFSPQALEDLRSDPAGDLTIDPEPLLLELLPEDNEDLTSEDTEPGPETPGEESPAPPEEPFSVGEALARYLLAISNDLNSEYVANCIRFRNRNGAGAGCPENPAFNASSYQQEQALVDELFSVITRQSDYARISTRLESENETLAEILDEPDNPAALQASTKIALNNAYLSYLNGNPNPTVTAFNTMNNFVNDYNRTIRVGPVQFRCKERPCVYKYTGPEQDQPR